MPHHLPIRLSPLLLALSVACLPVHAAHPASDAGSQYGSLDGRLTDTHSLPLVQAQVLLRNLDTGAVIRSATGKNGSYHFPSLGPGEYRLEADIPSLGHGAVEGILISAGHATRMQAALRMELPPPSPLELNLDTPDPISPAVTTSLSSEELSSLPVQGRDWQAIAAATTTAVPTGQPSHAGGSSIAEAIEADPGQGLALNSIDIELESTAIDGMTSLPAFRTETSHSRQSATELGPSAVESLHSRIGDAPAESPGIAGGIGYQSAHGHNGRLHGQAFYLSRESLWGALNPFTQWIRQTAPVNGVTVAQFTPESYSPANSQQTFGLGLGSQLRRNKLWWFGALDGQLRSDPAVATVRHPDSFFAQPATNELTVLAARLDLPGPAILEQGAAAYSDGLAGLSTLLGPVPRRAGQWQSFARLDWQLTERQHLNLESGYSHETAPAGSIRATSATFGSHSFGNSQATDLWQLAQSQTFLTANLLNSASAQFHTYGLSDTAQTPSAFEEPLLTGSLGQLPEIIADSKFGFVLGKPARLTGSRYPFETLLAARESLSWVHGTHLIKAGASFDHAADAIHSLLNQTGTYSYADVLNLISDRASFLQYGFNAINNPNSEQHNCDSTGRVHTSGGILFGLGPLPCYAWFTQRIGPSNWHVSTNNLAAFLTDQCSPHITSPFPPASASSPNSSLLLSPSSTIQPSPKPKPFQTSASSGLHASA